MRSSIVRYVMMAVLLLGLGAIGEGMLQSGRPEAPHLRGALTPGAVPVVYVDDGDTIIVRVAGKDETVRMVGMDTPEVKDRRKPVQCYGREASAETHHLLDGKQVRLSGDPQDSDRDKYHRLLRYVYLLDGTMVNQYLTEHGYAFAYTVFVNSKLNLFEHWEQTAHQRRLGLWSACQVHRDGPIEQTNGVGPPPT